MDVKSINFLSGCGIIFSVVLLLIFCTCLDINAMPDARVFTKNITNSEGILEVNPRFVGDGSSIVFLEYQNSNEENLPWDYKLVMSDHNGHHFNYLTETGVIDYEVMSDGSEIRYLFSTEKHTDEAFDDYTYYNQVDEWELWQLDLKTDSRKLLEKSNGRLLAEGYRLLGGRGLPDYYEGKYTTFSPQGNNIVFIQIEDSAVNFYHVSKSGKKLLHSSELYKTHGHVPWVPQVVWQSEDSFYTLDYQSENNSFRIINLNLNKNETTIVYAHEKINAFPRLNLDEFGTMLYFTQSGINENTELWRINLNDNRPPEFIYSHHSQLGTAFSSMDGSSIVFSQLNKNDFDIIRLDFANNKIQRLTSN